ncbi:YoaK family protein [Methylobacterium sp. sgz302541]|uniref:YoaK family protein n=1 Tax=unclassified Methylobacterium TaxID=2615210 RepID=UPI003D33E5F9
MLIQEGDARTPQTDERLAWTFAAVAGALNAAGFYAFGFYSSNMTGNVSALADHLGIGEGRLALQALALVAAFVTGAMLATLLTNAGRRRRLRGVYAYSIFAEAVLLAVLGVAEPWLTASGRGTLLPLCLSFLLGLQNATVTQITNARVRTTHVTGMVTDIGIGLANLLERHPTIARGKLRLHVVTVVAFLLGGICGVLAYRLIGTSLLLLAAAALLMMLALPGITSLRRDGIARMPPMS